MTNQTDQLNWFESTKYLEAPQREVFVPSPASLNLYEAKARLSELVERAAAGEEIVIAKHGSPRARLVPLHTEDTPRIPGGWGPALWVADDFDEPLPDAIRRFFQGETP